MDKVEELETVIVDETIAVEGEESATSNTDNQDGQDNEATPVEDGDNGTPEDETVVETPEPEDAAKVQKGVEKRIGKLTFRAKSAEERLIILQKENDDLKAKNAPKVPKEDDFETTEEYIDAKVEYNTNQKLSANKDLAESTRNAEAKAQRLEEIAISFDKSVETARTTYADFDSSVANIADSFSDEQQIALAESGADVLYHISKDFELLDSMSSMSSTQFSRQLGKIEATLESKPKVASQKKTTTAPKPVNPVSNGSLGRQDLDDLEGDEYFEARRASERKNKG